MTIEANILKGKSFPIGSKDRLKAVMVSLLVYLPGLALAYDFYESLHYGYETMAMIELVTMLISYGFYMLFPRYLSIDTIAKIIFVIYTLFLLSTLFIPDYNAQYSLFWFATPPVIAFFFLVRRRDWYGWQFLLSGLCSYGHWLLLGS